MRTIFEVTQTSGLIPINTLIRKKKCFYNDRIGNEAQIYKKSVNFWKCIWSASEHPGIAFSFSLRAAQIKSFF